MAEVKEGIVIEFKGKTVEFDRSVKGVDTALKSVQTQIKALNKDLKLDPTNVDALKEKFSLLSQKQKILNEQIQNYQNSLANFSKIDTKAQGREFDRTLKTLNELQNQLKKVKDEMALLNVQEVNAFGIGLEKAGKTLDSIGKSITSIGKELAVISATASTILATGVKYNAELEQYQVALETITGSASETAQIMSDIRKDAQSTPFGVSDLIKYNRLLLSTGIDAEEAEKVVMALGDAISATGGDSYTFERMAYNLQQIKNMGQAYAIDIRQFGNSFIDIYGILSDYTGKTKEEISKMISDGQVTYELISGALIQASQEGGKYYGAMEKQAGTLSGQWTKLKDDAQLLASELTESLMPVLKELLDKAKQLIKRFREIPDSTKEMITKFLLFATVISPLVLGIGALVTKIGSISKSLGSFLQGKEFLLKLEKLTSFFTKMTAFKGSATALLGTLTGIIVAIALMFANSEDLRNSVGNFFVTIWEALSSIIKPLWEFLSGTLFPLISQLAGYLGDILAPIIDILVEVLKIALKIITDIVTWIKKMWEEFKKTTLGQMFIKMFENIIEAIKETYDWIKNLVGGIRDAINWFGELIGVSEKASNVRGNIVGGGGGHYTQSGGYASGGYTIATTINVNNNGGEISTSEINRWADVITSKVNRNLGRLM